MGRFKWLEVEGDKKNAELSGADISEKKKNSREASLSAAQKISGLVSVYEAQKKSDAQIRFGKISESDGVIYDSSYFKNAGLTSYENCEYENALFNFSKCLSENNKDEDAWLYQVLAQIQLGKYSDALIWAKKAYEYFGVSAAAQSMYALTLALCNDKESAIAYSDGALAKKTPCYFLWFARGEILLNMKNYNNAFVCFQKCRDFKNMNGAKNLDFEIAMALVRTENYSRALSYFKKAVQNGMCNFYIYERIAYLNEKLDFLNEAQFYYRQSINLKSTNNPSIEGEARVKGRNKFLIRLFNKIYNFFKLGGQKNEP